MWPACPLKEITLEYISMALKFIPLTPRPQKESLFHSDLFYENSKLKPEDEDIIKYFFLLRVGLIQYSGYPKAHYVVWAGLKFMAIFLS